MKPLRLMLAAFLVLACDRVVAAGPVAASAPVQSSASAAGSSFNPLFSADGQHLVFVSHANNLVTNDDLGLSLDVFVRDLVNSNTVLVSVSTNGTGGANWDANYPSISSNGQFIAFASRASNLAPGDANGAMDIFVRDVSAGITRLVSVDVSDRAPFDPTPSSIVPLSGNPMISGDGRWVFFESRATNLVAGGAPLGSVNIYARDTWSNLTVLVSTTATGNAAGGKCELAGLAADGGTVAFITTDTAIMAGVSNTGAEVYVRQLQPPFTIWASSNAAARVGFPYSCGGAALNAGGRYVAFTAGGLTNFVFRRDLLTGALIPLNLSSNIGSSGVQISDDGSRVLFDLNNSVYVWREEAGTAVRIGRTETGCGPEGAAGGPDTTYKASLGASGGHVSSWSSCEPYSLTYFRHDLLTGTNRSLFVPSDGGSLNATTVLSPSGETVAYSHPAGYVVPNDLNGASDVFLRNIDAGVTELISKAQPAKPTTTALARSTLGPNSISADGRYVVFTSFDDPSAFRDTNGWSDVVLADLLTGTRRSLTLDTNIFGQPFYVENTNAYGSPIISGNGSAFAALRLGNLSLINLLAAPTQIALAGAFRNFFGQEPNGTYTAPSLSADGDLLAFHSTATDFTEDADNNNALDVFVRYRPGVTNPNYAYLITSNFLISRATNGAITGNRISTKPLVNADGRWLGFLSMASNLVQNPTPDLAFPAQPNWAYPALQLVVGDLGTNRLASNFLAQFTRRLCSYTIWTNASPWNPNPEQPNTVLRPLTNEVASFVFSANARFLVFGLSDGSAIYRHDFSGVRTNWYEGYFQSNGFTYTHFTNSVVFGAPNLLVCTNGRNPSVSADGSVVVFERARANSNLTDLFATDLTLGEETLVSATPTGFPANGSSSLAQISPDGRYVVFQSAASDLVGIDTNKASDIFVRDRWLGVTLLVSGNASGLPGNGPSTRPVMAADGRTVVFQSFASDLVSGDYNDQRDLFVLKLGGADRDGDGLDDDWEVAYFENTSRNGSGDFDGDGSSDSQEFLAATDPTNAGSIFRVLTVSPAGGGGKLLFWTGNPARSYRAESKDDLSAANWTALPGTNFWNGTTASILDFSATNSVHRYYRVVRLP